MKKFIKNLVTDHKNGKFLGVIQYETKTPELSYFEPIKVLCKLLPFTGRFKKKMFT